MDGRQDYLLPRAGIERRATIRNIAGPDKHRANGRLPHETAPPRSTGLLGRYAASCEASTTGGGSSPPSSGPSGSAGCQKYRLPVEVGTVTILPSGGWWCC